MKHPRLARLLLVLSPVALLAVGELGARLLVDPGRPAFPTPPLFRPLEGPDGPVVNASGERLYSCDGVMVALHADPTVGRRVCTRTKTAGTLRIFTLGGSTTYGLGYAPQASFSRFLEVRLRVLLGRDVEVVNTGISGFDSDLLPGLLDELLAFAPDLLIVYAGHNELKYPHLARVQHPARFALLRMLSRLRLVQGFLRPRSAVALPAVIDTPFLLPEDWQRAEDQYAAAIASMAASARDAGVPIFFCEPVSNVLDKEPRLTVVGGEDAAAAADRAALVEALLALCPAARGKGKLLPAGVDGEARLAHLEAILARHPAASLAHYLRARILLAQGDLEAARAAFRRSLETDALPERAPPRLVARLEALLREEDARYVPLANRFTAEAARGVPGNDLYLDYCHPTLRGHWIIADEILAALEVHSGWGSFDRDAEQESAAGVPLYEHYCSLLGVSEDSRAAQVLDIARAKIGEALAKTEPERSRLMLVVAEMVRAAQQMQPDSASGHLLRAIVEGHLGNAERCWESLEFARRADPALLAEYAGRVATYAPLTELFAGARIEVRDGAFRRTGQRSSDG
jgi:lysophospholipase L1-like esterase